MNESAAVSLNSIKTSPLFERITAAEIAELRDSCLEHVKAREIYELRNAAKIRAVNTTSSYEEFKDIVDAAHLRPISKQDKANANTKTRLWNTTVREE